MYLIAKSPGHWLKIVFCIFATALATGCASGGFKLTRQYARFVNGQNIIVRIVLYILTSIVFAVTMLVDMVIFNTMDFWQGRVSQGTYEFTEKDKLFHVRHEIQPINGLKQSTIHIYDKSKTLLQVVQIKQTAAQKIELFVDGQLRSQVRDIHSLPIATVFDGNGISLGDRLVFTEPSLQLARFTQ